MKMGFMTQALFKTYIHGKNEVYNTELGRAYTSNEPLITLVCFNGKSLKPAFHYRYQTIEQRDNALNTWIKNINGYNEIKSQRKAERENYTHTLKVGDILYNSWGWEQTNIDFYQVIKVPTPKTVVIQEIAQHKTETGFMCGDTTPIPNQFAKDSKPMLKHVRPGNYITMEFGSCTLSRGTQHYSSYA